MVTKQTVNSLTKNIILKLIYKTFFLYYVQNFFIIYINKSWVFKKIFKKRKILKIMDAS